MTENASFIGAAGSSGPCDDDEDIRESEMAPGCGIETLRGRPSGYVLEDGIPDVGTACECESEGEGDG